MKRCSTCEEAKIIHKIFETNSSFHVKRHTTGKVQFLFFRRFLLGLTKCSFLEEGWALDNNSMKFWDFPDITFFFVFLWTSFFLFPYVHEIQYNQNLKTHICSLLSTMPKYIHTNMKPIYTNAILEWWSYACTYAYICI